MWRIQGQGVESGPMRSPKGGAMGSARMQPNSFEQLRASLDAASWTHDFLADYVTEVGRQIREEDIFQRMAFRCASLAGNADGSATENVLWLYEAMSPEAQTELRRW